MKNFFKKLISRAKEIKLLKENKGQGMVEYVLLLVVIIGLVFAFKKPIVDKFNQIVGKTTQGMDDVIQ